jgi:autonomous glycyl radical cofactor GrcA
MKIRLALVALFAFALTQSPAGAQSLSFTKGQNVSPAYEGWEEAADGTKYFLFGYMNRNWEEELNVPVGADNSFSPGNPDQGQPTHFLPRRNRFVFRVPAPKSFTEKDELIWTLTTYGKTEKAYATLRLDYKVDDVVKASETGALGAGTSSPEVRANKPPVVKVEGPKTLTAKVGQPLTLTTLVTDDGIPKRRVGGGSAAVNNAGSRRDANAAAAGRGGSADPAQQRQNRAMLPPARVTVGKNVGLHLSWFVYRGAGAVTFDPEQVKPWEDTRAGANSPWAPLWTPPEMPADGKVVVHATFTEPGTYILRGLADDGALFGSDEVTITVRP